MGDSSEMTIEFLRARLLTERSVSKTARQRADELAKRVMVLEEQLNLVSLQRKKAEKATADVLAILENHAMTEFSEDFSSSSDEEATHCESKARNSSMNDESSATSKVSKNDKDGFSGSEIETSRIPGRSLSWKSGKESSHSREKSYANSSSRRRRSSSTSTDSSSAKRVGKSCRQIRRKETRLAVEELNTGTDTGTSQDNGVTTCSDDYLNCHDSESGVSTIRNQEEKLSPEDPALGVSQIPRDAKVDGPFLIDRGSDKDMERALRHQAQLIGQYEAEEKAQREWEEKFRENNSSTPDSCEPGNQSDVTDERDEIKAPTPEDPAAIISSQDQEAKSQSDDVYLTKESSQSHFSSFQPLPHVSMGSSRDQRVVLSSTELASESSASEFTFPSAKGKQIQDCSQSCGLQLQGKLENQSTPVTKSSQAGSNFPAEEGTKKELSLVPSNNSDQLGSVLEALNQAKLSLTHKLNTKPLSEDRSIVRAIEPSLPAVGPGDNVDVPVGATGLFRVPTDFQFEATAQANFPGSGSRLSSMNHYPGRGISTHSGGKFITSPAVESRFDFSNTSRFSTMSSNRSMESIPRFPSFKPFLDPRFDVGVPSHNQFSEPCLDTGASSHKPFFEPQFDVGVPSNKPFSDPRFDMGVPSRKAFYEPHLDLDAPLYRRYTSVDPNLGTSLQPPSNMHPSYPDFAPQMTSNERTSRTSLSGESAIPPGGSHYSPFYNDQIRPNMYR